MAKYISIDIGGTSIKYGVIDDDVRILRKGETDTNAWEGGAAIVERVLGLIEMLKKDLEISGICISTAGIVDIGRGVILHSSPLIPGYIGVGWKATVEQKFGIPCEVENDVNCAGLAEYISGAAKGSSLALMLTIGTGIGGCLVENGSVYHGCCGSGCEVGYMHLPGGAFQDLGASSVMTRKVAEWKEEPVMDWNGRRIFLEAKNGDEFCIRAIEEMVDTLGQGIANLCYILNPEVVVLGGGIMAQEEFLKEKIQSSVKNYLIPYIAEHTQIQFALHQNEAGMLGAFYHFQKIHRNHSQVPAHN